MLALSFFAAIFSTLIWLIYSIAYISDNTVGIKLSALGIANLSTYVGLVILPIFSLWVIFGYINQYLNLRNTNQNLCILFRQMKKNMDYTDLVARIMLESEQQIKDGFILNRIDILIADMNELIAEIISRANLCSKDQIEGLWSKVQNGGKWAFGKVIIEISQIQPNFQMRIFEKSRGDIVLAGTILEFCARYQNILVLLEKHDKERVFLEVIETGIFGKVFTILAPLADEIRRHREPVTPNHPFEQPVSSSPVNSPVYHQAKAPAPRWEQQLKDTKTSIIGKLGSLIKKDKLSDSLESKGRAQPDPFSMALERSFGSRGEELPQLEEPEEVAVETQGYHNDFTVGEARFDAPHFENEYSELVVERELKVEKFDEPQIESPLMANSQEENMSLSAPSLDSSRFDGPRFDEPQFDNVPLETVTVENLQVESAPLSNTQKTLNELKKEWEGMRKTQEEPSMAQAPAAKAVNEDLAYPFGGWSDESTYRK